MRFRGLLLILDREIVLTVIQHFSFNSQIVCLYTSLHTLIPVLHLVLLNEASLEPDAVLSLTCSIKTILVRFSLCIL